MLEKNKIYLGDCDKLIKEIPDNSIDLIHTDPPYLKKMGGRGKSKISKSAQAIKEDLKNITDGIKNVAILDEFCRVLKKINLYIWCSKDQLSQYINYFENKGCYIDLITWHKSNVIPACNNTYMSDTEYCLFFREKGVPIYGTVETKRKYYITQTNKKDKAIWEHPTIKPLHIVKNLIINSSKEGDIILDCFSGSGTTAIACTQLKRNFIGMEIDKTYYDLSMQRLQAEQAQQKLF